jgi:hypothetical protein
MEGQNLYPVDLFISKLDHPRKQELATMLIEGTTIEAVSEAGFNRVIVLEMCREIRRNVVGMASFDFEYPRTTESVVVDSEVVDAPVVDAPVVDTPVVDAPVVDAPVVDAPVVDTPVTNDQNG